MFVGTGTLRKPAEYRQARQLRRDFGMSLKTIASRLEVSVSTVHGWTRDIELTAEQRARNLARAGQPGSILAEGRRRKARAVRAKHQLEGRRRAREGDPLHLAGCMLTGNGVSPEDIERRWLGALALPPSVLTKHIVDSLPTSSSGRKTNRLPYGVCKLTVRRSVGIIQHIYGAIQEYAGFDEPAWLG